MLHQDPLDTGMQPADGDCNPAQPDQAAQSSHVIQSPAELQQGTSSPLDVQNQQSPSAGSRGGDENVPWQPVADFPVQSITEVTCMKLLPDFLQDMTLVTCFAAEWTLLEDLCCRLSLHVVAYASPPFICPASSSLDLHYLLYHAMTSMSPSSALPGLI